jgi:hypothetical protein
VKQFAIVGCGLQGHDAQIDVTLSDFGAYGREGFPTWITGADNAFDTHALYGVDPAHMFDEDTPASSITYRFDGFVPEMSTDQVTVGMITGALCPANLTPSPWSMAGPWRHMWRRDALLKFDVSCPRGNGTRCRAAPCTSRCMRRSTAGRRTRAPGYYSDYYKSKGVHILPSCSFKGGSMER